MRISDWSSDVCSSDLGISGNLDGNARANQPMTIVSAALLLFLILDPLGNVPVVLSLLRPLTPQRQRLVMIRELLIALGVLLVFLWFGKYALDLMHLRQESVSIAGGIVLLLHGLRMLFTPAEG